LRAAGASIGECVVGAARADAPAHKCEPSISQASLRPTRPSCYNSQSMRQALRWYRRQDAARRLRERRDGILRHAHRRRGPALSLSQQLHPSR